MRHQINRSPFVTTVCVGLLAGCGPSPNSPTLTGALSAKVSGLSTAQKTAVKAAAQQMVGDPTATVHGLKGQTRPGAAGIHVCGYVKMPANASTPLYIELRETNGATTAERGQIGATPANLAKVRFMCRGHGEW